MQAIGVDGSFAVRGGGGGGWGGGGGGGGGGGHHFDTPWCSPQRLRGISNRGSIRVEQSRGGVPLNNLGAPRSVGADFE